MLVYGVLSGFELKIEEWEDRKESEDNGRESHIDEREEAEHL